MEKTYLNPSLRKDQPFFLVEQRGNLIPKNSES